MVLGMDFKEKIQEIHPNLDDCQGTKNISDDTILRLSITIQNLREIKIQRLQRVSIDGNWVISSSKQFSTAFPFSLLHRYCDSFKI